MGISWILTWDYHALQVMLSIKKGQQVAAVRKQEQAKAAALKRTQRAQETQEAAVRDAGVGTQQISKRKAPAAKGMRAQDAASGGGDPGRRGRGREGGRRGGRTGGRAGGRMP